MKIFIKYLLPILLFTFSRGVLYSQRISIDGNKFQVYGQEIFINGVNTPWDNWNDFGGNYDHNFWNSEFQKIRLAGGNASRIWITCNGDVGINISTAGLVTGATTAHWEDLDDMFALAQQHKIYIMATLISFDHTKNTYVKYQSWRNMFADTANVSSYVNSYVIPFINRYKDNPYLWCVDICNEIEWMHENTECGNISWNNLQYFAARVAAAVHENSPVLVTLGSAAVKWNSDYPGCEGNFWSDQSLQAQYDSPEAFLDFYSPHFYGWVVRWFGNFAADRPPDSYGINDRPCMVGENPAKGIYKQNTSGQDELVIPISEAYIKTYQQGWKGLMVWTSNGVDGNGSLTNCGVGLTAFKNRYPELVSPSPIQPDQYDSIIDIRDGQVYKIVKIDNQWWMQENLNIGIEIDGMKDAADNDTIEKYCYNDLETNCNIYGGLYQWDEMMYYNPSDSSITGTTNGICPSNWHIPTDAEWKELEKVLGMSQDETDKNNTWRGSDEGDQLKSGSSSGFEAMMGGDLTLGNYSEVGTSGLFWTSGESDNLDSYYRKITSGYSGIFRGDWPKKSGLSVRCIKDPCLLEGVTLSKTDITCHGNSDGSVNLSFIGSGKMNFIWSNGDTTQNIQSLNPGWYSVKVFDSIACSLNDSIEILEPGQLLISQADFSEFICAGGSNGFISIIPSGGTAPYSYTWSNGMDSQDISDLAPGNYSVTVKDQNNCQVSDTFDIQSAVAYDDQEICLVTFDPNTGKNLIIWEKTPGVGIQSFNIYRESNTAEEYILIGTRDFERPGYFIDQNSDPGAKTYKYRIATIDACGNESNKSSYHKTMLMLSSAGLNEINLSWIKYEGFEVQQYNIWRGPDINNLSVLESLSADIDMYTDNSPLPGTNIYQLEAVSSYSCNPDTLGITYSSSFSYLPGGKPEGFNELTCNNSIDIYPNPFNEATILQFSNPYGSKYELFIMDLSGKVCRLVDNITTSEYLLEKGDLKRGYYLIELRGSEIYRGRIIIE